MRLRTKALSGITFLLVIAISFYAKWMIDRLEFVDDHRVWSEEREVELRREDSSWLNLAGLFWLEEGRQSFGADRSMDLRLRIEGAPEYVGDFIWEEGNIAFEAAEGVDVRHEGEAVTRVVLEDDGMETKEPTVLELGSLRWWLIARDGMMGIRVKDVAHPEWLAFEGLDLWNYEHDWRVEAQYVPFETPQSFTYPTILGTTRSEEAPGLLVFEIDGQQYEMVPFERTEGTRLFLVFGDDTNGNDTYGGGRFLYVDMPGEDGEATIDFNKAYNPPCAFTPYSTCPQPLEQNKLATRVEAGERKYVSPLLGS